MVASVTSRLGPVHSASLISSDVPAAVRSAARPQHVRARPQHDRRTSYVRWSSYFQRPTSEASRRRDRRVALIRRDSTRAFCLRCPSARLTTQRPQADRGPTAGRPQPAAAAVIPAPSDPVCLRAARVRQWAPEGAGRLSWLAGFARPTRAGRERSQTIQRPAQV